MAFPVRLSLCYDGSDLSHLETAVPQLASAGFAATFYAEPLTLLEELPEWRRVAANGHEIGNGTLIGAALPDGSLPAWTLEMVEEELTEAKALIDEQFAGQRRHSCALPFGSMECAEGSVVSVAQRIYPVVRGGDRGVNRHAATAILSSVSAEGLSGDELIQLVRILSAEPGFVVLVFGGVGTGDPGIDAGAHFALLQHLREMGDHVSVAPVCQHALDPSRMHGGSHLV